jgi:hypothetical protein
MWSIVLIWPGLRSIPHAGHEKRGSWQMGWPGSSYAGYPCDRQNYYSPFASDLESILPRLTGK